MVAPNDYYTGGTITLTNGSTAVTGALTTWNNQALKGDTIPSTALGSRLWAPTPRPTQP